MNRTDKIKKIIDSIWNMPDENLDAVLLSLVFEPKKEQIKIPSKVVSRDMITEKDYADIKINYTVYTYLRGLDEMVIKWFIYIHKTTNLNLYHSMQGTVREYLHSPVKVGYMKYIKKNESKRPWLLDEEDKTFKLYEYIYEHFKSKSNL